MAAVKQLLRREHEPDSGFASSAHGFPYKATLSVSSLIKQIQDFRRECRETAEELRLLDSQLHGIAED